MHHKIKRHQKVVTIRLHNNYLVKMFLQPVVKTGTGCVWVMSIATGKSIRQINQWFQRRKTRRSKKMATSLTGRMGVAVHKIGIEQMRQWYDELPPGDSISFRCESASPEKQFKVWKRWFEKNESRHWEIEEKYLSFFLYKPRVLQ